MERDDIVVTTLLHSILGAKYAVKRNFALAYLWAGPSARKAPGRAELLVKPPR